MSDGFGTVKRPILNIEGNPCTSLGGMLAAWGRMKFPHIFDGAIAGSAPIWTFLGEVRSNMRSTCQYLGCQLQFYLKRVSLRSKIRTDVLLSPGVTV